ncbi:hypothetical protein ACFLWC_04100 [Chloroflexota bacterium]
MQARLRAQAFNLSDKQVITLPIGELFYDSKEARAAMTEHMGDILPDIIAGIKESSMALAAESASGSVANEAPAAGLKSKQIDITEAKIEAIDIDAIYEHFDDKFWIDGSPIIPPTPERVKKFVDFTGRDPSDEIGVIPPLNGVVTVEKVAVHAVMAGCRPEYMPVLLTAAAILGDSKEPLPWMVADLLTTSHSRMCLLVVNGPIRKTLGITSGESGMTVSWRANATIGRAIQLLLSNIGGSEGFAGHTFGLYVTRGYCMGENEEQSPWEPFHVEYGFSPEDSTVTVFAVEPPRHYEVGGGAGAVSAVDVLRLFARTMVGPASRDSYGTTYPGIIFGPDHANNIAEAGFSKKDVKQFLFEHARQPLKEFGPGAGFDWRPHHKKFFTHSPDAMVPMVEKPDDFMVFMMGGPGPNVLHLACQKFPAEYCIRRIEV